MNNSPAKKNRLKKTLLAASILILLITGFIGWQIYRSYHGIIIRQEDYMTDKVISPVRILMMSDLHDHQHGNNNSEIIEKANSAQPDLILLNGDMINEDTQSIDAVLSLAESLKEIAPVYYSPGNKELENPLWNQFEAELEKNGIPVLDAEYEDLTINGQTIRLGGLYDYSFALNGKDTVEESRMNPETVEFLHEYQDSDFLKVIMTHRPDTFLFNQSVDYWNVDLALAGHTHGGQVILPGVGGLWAPDLGWFPEYVSGVKKLGATTLITSAGLGSGHEKLPRFNNPPEMLLVEIQPVISED